MSKIMSKKVSLIKEFYMNLGGFHIDNPNCERWTDEEWIAQADADDLDIMSQDNTIMSRTEFIKKHVLPYEDAEQQVLWHEGSIGYDDNYLEERATDLKIKIIDQDDGSKSSDAYDEENLRHEVKFQLDCFREGKIEKEDFFQAIDEILYGKVKPPVTEKDESHSDADICDVLFRDFPREGEMILEYLDNL